MRSKLKSKKNGNGSTILGFDDFGSGSELTATSSGVFSSSSALPMTTSSKNSMRGRAFGVSKSGPPQVDVEALYNATPDQMRTAADSYAAESRRILLNYATLSSSPLRDEMDTRVRQYAAEARRLYDKADEIERSQKKGGWKGRGYRKSKKSSLRDEDPNRAKAAAVDQVFSAVRNGTVRPEVVLHAVRASEMAQEKAAASERAHLEAMLLAGDDYNEDGLLQKAGCCGAWPGL